MRTRGLRRDAGFLRQFAGRERAAAQQRGQHVGAGGVADKRGDHGDIGSCFHCSMVTEASMMIKRVVWYLSNSIVIARSGSDEAIQKFLRFGLDCFAEP